MARAADAKSGNGSGEDSTTSGQVVGAPTPDALANELDGLRQIIHDLRNPIGSVGMAIEILLGPLRGVLSQLEPDVARRVEDTLVALQESGRQLRHLVGDLGALANRSSGFQAPPAANTQLHAVPGQGLGSRPAVRTRTTRIEIEDLLRRLEILTVTRSALPALLAVDCAIDLQVDGNGPELLRGLSNLVENAIEASAAAAPGPGPWTVELCARRAEAEVVIEVRNQGHPLSDRVLSWLAGSQEQESPASTKRDGGLHGVGLRVARRVAEQFGGRLEGSSTGGTTCMRMCFPASEVEPVETPDTV